MDDLKKRKLNDNLEDDDEQSTVDNGNKNINKKEDYDYKTRLCSRYIEMYNNHVVSFVNERKRMNIGDQILLDSGIGHKFGKLEPSIISDSGDVYTQFRKNKQQRRVDNENEDSHQIREYENTNNGGESIASHDSEEEEDHVGNIEEIKKIPKDSNDDGIRSNGCSEDDDDTSDPEYNTKRIKGTHWSSVEKEVFFTSLARYSIHNLEAIKMNLPMKSEKEILTYYKVLKKNFVSKDRSIKRIRRDTYKFIPIAFEMDEAYIKIENRFADILSELELAKVERLKSQFHLNDRKNRGKSDRHLLQIESLYELTKKIYWNQHIMNDDYDEDIFLNRQPPPLSERTVYKLLEVLIYRYTVGIIEQLILLKNSDIGNFKNAKHQSTRLASDVSLEDVQKVLLQKFVIGKDSNGIINPVCRAVYFKNIEERLMLMGKKKKRREEESKEFESALSHFELQRHFVDCLDTDNNSNNTFFKYLDSLAESYRRTKVFAESNKGLREESGNADIQEDLNSDIDEDLNADIEEDLNADVEEDLCLDIEEECDADIERKEKNLAKETETLEEKDMEISKKYQRMMLHFLNADI